MPWTGYINKIFLSDVFVLTDNMEYTHYHYINRNRIIGNNGILMLSVPVRYKKHSKNLINEIYIDNLSSKKKLQNHLKSIRQYYSRCEGFSDFFPFLERSLNRPARLLFDLSYDVLKTILEYLEINTKIVLASALDIKGNKNDELVLSILRETGCDKFLFGLGASAQYVNIKKLLDEGYSNIFQKFIHPVYKQQSNNFVQGISIIDLLLNVPRNEAIELIRKAGSYEARH